MRHSLHSHIIYLENRIQSLRDDLTRHHMSRGDLQELEEQISLAELALERYREAYALESSLSSPDPADSPGTKPGDGTGSPEKSNSDKKKGGAAIRRGKVRVRRLPSPAAHGRTSAGLPSLKDAGTLRKFAEAD